MGRSLAAIVGRTSAFSKGELFDIIWHMKEAKLFSISANFKEAEKNEKTFWFSQTPIFRLQHLESLRKMNYGKDASHRLQRIFEVTKRA